MRASLFLMLLFSSLCSDEEIARPEPLAQIAPFKTEDGYTINYNTVSIIEYIRFASKICKVNFIYNESELNFTVTVVSDEPVTPSNVMATLLQVLRIHGLLLLEQDNNLVIHKSADVKQVATLVTEGSREGSASIVTRIFRIKNAKPESIAAIIQPMISSSALLETSAETRQLILTDVKANVDKIAALIENLDSPHTLLEIKSFSVKHNKPVFLIELANQIMSPLAQGNPFILVPQNLANEVFIVSTPDLVQKAMAVLVSLDTIPKMRSSDTSGFEGNGDPLINTQFYIYKPIHRTGEELASALKEVTAQLKADKLADPAFMGALATMKWVKSTNSILFTGDPAALQKIQTLMATLDKPLEKGLPSYYIYKVLHTTGDVIEEDLDALAKNFKASGVKDPKLLEVIDKIRYVKQTNSLLMGGDPRAIEEVKALIAQYDYPRAASESSSFYMYKPHHLPAHQIEKSLKEISTNLKTAGLADPALLRSIESMKYVEATNSLIFTGSPDALQKIQGLLKDVDVPAAFCAAIQHIGKTTFLLYKLKNASGPQIVSALKNIVAEMKNSCANDRDFLAALSSIKYVKETNSLFFTGTEESLSKVQTLVEKFDVPSLAPQSNALGASNFFMYKPQSLPGPELEKVIFEFAENLSTSGLNDPDLFNAIKSMRWTDKTNTLVFTGTPKALEQVKELLREFDNPSGDLLAGKDASIQSIENTNFLVYKLQFHKGDEIQTALRQIAKDLISSNAHINQGLLNSINSLQWLQVTNSLLCSGDQEVLTRLRELIKNLDVPLKQVFIEMLMIETTLSNALTFGLEWGANFKYRNKFSGNSYNTPPNLFTGGNNGGATPAPDPFVTNLAGLNSAITPVPSKIPPPVSGFDLGVIGEVIKHNGQTFLTLGSLLSALQQDSEISVIMTPKIITQDGRTSTLFRGENIPFVGSFISNQGNNTINTSNIEYRDIGVNLTITPILGNSDIVTLDINLDRSQTTGDITQASLQPGAQTANGIITSKTTMQTTVHVPDNNFLILTGMVNNSNAKVKAGIPCLGGLPLVGAFFSQNNDSITNSNIVIFIRPHIINSMEDMRKVSTKEEDYFRDQAGSPFLERGFDEGMELIKTVDDE